MTFDSDPLECLDCGQRWDDLDPEADKCGCKRGLTRPIPAADLTWPNSREE